MSVVVIARPLYLSSAINSSMHLLFLERKGVAMFFLQPLLCRVYPPPHRRRPHARQVTGRHQQLRLVGFQRLGSRVGFRPPYESSLGEPLLRQPVSLAVIAEETNRSPPAAAKHEHASGKWIFGEFPLAKPRQGVNALATIDGLDGHQHAHLCGDLDHPSASRQARSKPAQSSGAAAFQWMRILPQPADSNSMTQSSSVAACGAISSTNACLAAFRRTLGTPPSRFFSPI